MLAEGADMSSEAQAHYKKPDWATMHLFNQRSPGSPGWV